VEIEKKKREKKWNFSIILKSVRGSIRKKKKIEESI